MTVATEREDLGFWVDSPDPLPCPPLHPGNGSVRAQVAVVGAGFAGLSTAYELMRRSPGLDVVIVESAVAGAGASGRNTGILRPGVGGTILDLCRRFGEPTAQQLYAASLSAVDYVRAIIADEGIDCDLEDVPHVKLALTSRQADHLREEAETLARLGFAADWSEKPAVPVPNRGGLSYPGSGQLNPALLVRGLKRAVLQQGARIFEHTPVTAITPGRPARLFLGGGATLVADRVVLATNAHTPRLGFLAGQVVPLQTHVGMTEALTSSQLAEIGWTGRCSFSDKRQVFDYYRLTRDNRLVFGGGRPVYEAVAGDRNAGATDVADPGVWHTQRAQVARTFPCLSGVTVSRQWAGTVGMTLDRFPVIGEIAPGVIVAAGWSGHGVHLATASGALIADLVLDLPNPSAQLPWLRTTAPRVPADPARGVGLRAYVRALQWADRLETLLDRNPIPRRSRHAYPCRTDRGLEPRPLRSGPGTGALRELLSTGEPPDETTRVLDPLHGLQPERTA